MTEDIQEVQTSVAEDPAAVESKEEDRPTTASFYTVQETDYLTELSQLVNAFPSGDVRDGIVAIRNFSLVTGKILLAIVVSELNDSFIVIHPFTHVTEDSGEVVLTRGSIRPLTRLYKSIIGLISIPIPTVVFPYLKAVKRITDELPGFFNESRKSQIDSLLIQLKPDNAVDIETDEDLSLGDKFGARPGSYTPPEFLERRMKH